MPKISDQQLKTRFGLSVAVLAKETLPISRAEVRNVQRSKYSQQVLILWCPHCGRSRKDIDAQLPGLAPYRCGCGAQFK